MTRWFRCAALSLLLIVAIACGGDESEPEAATDANTDAVDVEPTDAPLSGDVDNTDLTTKPVPPLPDGDVTELRIDDLVEGDGEPVAAGDEVAVQYVGVLATDGEQFDASWDRGGAPFEFVVGAGRVISGWDEGLVGMRPGGRRVLTIPSQQAYGTNGQGGIPGDADLVFVVDLISVSKPITVESLFDDGRTRPTPPLPGGAVDELVLEDLIVGDGAVAEVGDRLRMHYVGVLADGGSEFDSSWDRGPDGFEFFLGRGQVIKGWDDGVAGMAEGGRRVLTIPAADAYGEAERGGIPSNSDLVFVVDLVDVLKAADAGDAPEIVWPDELTDRLEITDEVAGDGSVAELGDVARLHIVLGAYNTRQIVDSTWEDGFPVDIQIGTAVIDGLDQGVIGMAEGGRRIVVVPPDLAFGDDGLPPDIASGETLVLVIDLIEILAF